MQHANATSAELPDHMVGRFDLWMERVNRLTHEQLQALHGDLVTEATRLRLQGRSSYTGLALAYLRRIDYVEQRLCNSSTN